MFVRNEVGIDDTPKVGLPLGLVEVDVQLLLVLTPAIIYLLPQALNLTARDALAFGGPAGDESRPANGALVNNELD